jgi:hypothetical protein
MKLINILLFIFVLAVNTLFSAEEDIDQDILHAFRGMDDTIMRLRTGICRIEGQTTQNNEKKPEIATIIFDYDKGYYRVDRSDECRSLCTPEYYYELWHPNRAKTFNSGATRQPLSTRTPSYLAKPFDIRMLSFMSLVGPYWDTRYEFDFRQSLFDERPLSYTLLSNGLIEIVTERKPINPLVPPLKRKYWVAPKQGYTLIKAKYADIDTIELSWTEKNGTWVPTSYKLTSTQPFSAEWQIQWEKVNVDIPNEHFDPSLLSDVPVTLFSDELGQPIQIGQLGKGVTSIIDQPKVKYPYTRSILIIAGLILMFIAFMKMAYDRWNKKD